MRSASRVSSPCLIRFIHRHSKLRIQSAVNTHNARLIDVATQNRRDRISKGTDYPTARHDQLSTLYDQRFIKYQKQVLKSKSSTEIRRILQSRDDFDIYVYTAAIKRLGMLQNIDYCKSIMSDILSSKSSITPNAALFNILFQAFNANLIPLQSDCYFADMIKTHKIKPDAIMISTLLAGCTKTGNIKRAKKIWNVMLYYDITPTIPICINMIVVCGQNGNWKLAQKVYTQMIADGNEPNVASQGAMLHALLKNNQIEIANKMKKEMQTNGDIFNSSHYLLFISFYLRDNEYLDPMKALKLMKECIVWNKLNKFDDALLGTKYVALYKLLQQTKECEYKRKRLFEKIKNAPKERLENGMNEWNFTTANIVFAAYLEYYRHDYDRREVIECFEYFCNEIQMMGYWYYCKQIDKWMLDLHGFGYEQIEFCLHHFLKKEWKKLIDVMQYEWIIICGKGQSKEPHKNKEKDTKPIGIKPIIQKLLRIKYGIKSKTMAENAGRLILREKDLKKYVDNKMELL